MFERITFFDVETPNRNNHRICSIGIVQWENGHQVLAKEWLIQPECPFDSFNVRLHGISPQMVAHAPNFKAAWPELQPFFEGALVVAHNAAFDMGVLTKVLEAYGLEQPSCHYACTVQMAKRRLPKQSFNLAALSASLGVVLSRHHNALADTLACAGIYRHLVALKPLRAVDYKAYGPSTPKSTGQALTDGQALTAGVSDKPLLVGETVGTRGLLFSFDHIGMRTNVYAINGSDVIYIVDTYLGPDIMAEIDRALHAAFGPKPKIIINTHHDWDHIWGNCRYRDQWIVGHERCKELIGTEGPKQLLENGEGKGLTLGTVVLTPPNLTLTDRINFEADGLTVWHTPGHTADSISIWDTLDKVLVAGDNLERPHPFTQWSQLDVFERSLESYLALPIAHVITGHTGVEGKALIEENLAWLRQERQLKV